MKLEQNIGQSVSLRNWIRLKLNGLKIQWGNCNDSNYSAKVDNLISAAFSTEKYKLTVAGWKGMVQVNIQNNECCSRKPFFSESFNADEGTINIIEIALNAMYQHELKGSPTQKVLC